MNTNNKQDLVIPHYYYSKIPSDTRQQIEDLPQNDKQNALQIWYQELKAAETPLNIVYEENNQTQTTQQNSNISNTQSKHIKSESDGKGLFYMYQTMYNVNGDRTLTNQNYSKESFPVEGSVQNSSDTKSRKTIKEGLEQKEKSQQHLNGSNILFWVLESILLAGGLGLGVYGYLQGDSLNSFANDVKTCLYDQHFWLAVGCLTLAAAFIGLSFKAFSSINHCLSSRTQDTDQENSLDLSNQS